VDVGVEEEIHIKVAYPCFQELPQRTRTAVDPYSGARCDHRQARGAPAQRRDPCSGANDDQLSQPWFPLSILR
jgi:hypothetical protein